MLLRSLFGSWSFQIIPMAWGHACFGLDVFSCQFAKEILRHQTLQRTIDANTKRIVSDCQAYLDDYEKNGKPKYAVDIDRILEFLGE